MTILEDLGLEVKIVVDGSPLQEYEDKEQEPADDGFGDEIPKCRRYVEVNGETEFGVQVEVTQNNNYLSTTKKALNFKIDLDGEDEVAGCLLLKNNPPDLVEGREEHDAQEHTVRRFRFTTVSTVDDDDPERVDKDRKTAGHLGLLRVRVWRGEVDKSEGSSPEASDSSLPGSPCHTSGLDETQHELSEKALKGKALSHKATFSPAVPYEAREIFDFEYVDPFEVPLAIFYFKYRSRAILQDLMIIPRPREPSQGDIQADVDVDVDVDGLPLREIRRLARESLDILPLHEMRRLAQLRLLSTKEGNRVSSNGDIKREPGEGQISQRPRKFVKMSDSREAVDLTEDD